MMSHHDQRLLIIKPSSLGDIIHALPVLHALRSQFPKARIDWLVNDGFASLLAGHPDISHIVKFDRACFGGIGIRPSATIKFFRFIRMLRATHYDCVIDLQGLFRSGFLSWATGAKLRLGFSNAREGAGIFYNQRVRVNTDDHAVDRNMQLVQSLIGQENEISFPLSIDPIDTDELATFLRDSHVDINQPFIAVVPGARWETKIWPATSFAQAIDSLTNIMGWPIVLIGGPEDVDRCQTISSICKHKPVNLAGHTSIRQFAAMVNNASLVICHDSAAMHFAVAFHKPLVAILGPTNPAHTGPYRRIDSVLRIDLTCSPCYLRDLSRCKHEHRCMTELTVSAVVSAASSAMSHNVMASGLNQS